MKPLEQIEEEQTEHSGLDTPASEIINVTSKHRKALLKDNAGGNQYRDNLD